MKDQETAQGNSPQAEDQTWAQQLQQDSNVAFSTMVAAAALNISQNASFAEFGNSHGEPPPNLSSKEQKHELLVASHLPSPD